MMALLNDDEHPDIITWLPHGAGFSIFDKARFQSVIMPKYFDKGAKYTSFTRRLNRWNFIIQTNGKRQVDYFHPMFNRNYPEDCLQMSPMLPKNSIHALREHQHQRMQIGGGPPTYPSMQPYAGHQQMPLLGAPSSVMGSLGNEMPVLSQVVKREGNTIGAPATANISTQGGHEHTIGGTGPLYYMMPNGISQQPQGQMMMANVLPNVMSQSQGQMMMTNVPTNPAFAACPPMIVHQGFPQDVQGYPQGGSLAPSGGMVPAAHMVSQQFLMAPPQHQINYYHHHAPAPASMISANAMGQYQMAMMNLPPQMESMAHPSHLARETNEAVPALQVPVKDDNVNYDSPKNGAVPQTDNLHQNGHTSQKDDSARSSCPI